MFDYTQICYQIDTLKMELENISEEELIFDVANGAGIYLNEDALDIIDKHESGIKLEEEELTYLKNLYLLYNCELFLEIK